MLSPALGSLSTAIVNSTMSSEDFDTTDVSSTCTTQLAPGGIGAPVLMRAHSPSFSSFWRRGCKMLLMNYELILIYCIVYTIN